MSDGDDPDRCDLGRDVELLRQIRDRVDPEKTCGEALVDRRVEDRHHRCAGIDPPEGDRPVDLVPIRIGLVGLGVPLVVGGLRDTHHDECAGPADPRVEPLLDVDGLSCQFGDAPAPGVGRHDHERLSLGVPCTRSAARSVEDRLEGFGVDRLSRVVADHAPGPDDITKFHHHPPPVDGIDTRSPCRARPPPPRTSAGR